MKKLIAIIFALVGCLLWYTNSEQAMDALVPEEETRVEAPEESSELPVVEQVVEVDEREEIPTPEETIGQEEVAQEQVVTVSANCTDKNGAPMEGIELVLKSLPGEPSSFTDPKGDVELVLLSSDVRNSDPRNALFQLKSRGTVAVLKNVRLSHTEDTFIGHFKLEPGGVVEGRVFDWTGAPAVGAQVYCSEPVMNRQSDAYAIGRRWGMRPTTFPVTTGTDGRFVIEGVELSTFAICAHMPGSFHAISDAVSIRPGIVARPEDLVLEQAPPDSVIGGVVLTKAGEPRSSLDVYLCPTDGRDPQDRSRTDAEGSFLFVVEAGSVHTIRAGRPGHDPISSSEVMAGTRDLVIQPKDYGELLVIAKTPDGKTLQGFGADLRFQNGRMAPGAWGVSKDGQPIKMDVPQHEFFVDVSSNTCGMFRAGPFDPLNPPELVEAVMTPLPGLHGQVLSDGVPVPNATVEGYFSLNQERVDALRGGLHRKEMYRPTATATTDENGRFLLPMSPDLRIKNGFNQLHLRATGPGFAFGPELVVPLVEGASSADVVLHVAMPGAMEGQLLAASELDLRGMSISISRGDFYIKTALLNDVGGYRFDDLAPGKWQAVLLTGELSERESQRQKGWATLEDIIWKFEVREGEVTRFDLKHDPSTKETVKLAGTFLVNGAAPIGCTWQAFQNQTRVGDGRFDADGEFEAEFDEAGAAIVYIGFPLADYCGQAYVAAELTLHNGENHWSYDLSTAAMTVTGLAEAQGTLDERMQRSNSNFWEIKWGGKASHMSWSARLLCGPPGGLQIPHVPTGELAISRYVRHREVPESKQTVTLKAGDSKVVNLGE